MLGAQHLRRRARRPAHGAAGQPMIDPPRGAGPTRSRRCGTARVALSAEPRRRRADSHDRPRSRRHVRAAGRSCRGRGVGAVLGKRLVLVGTGPVAVPDPAAMLPARGARVNSTSSAGSTSPSPRRAIAKTRNPCGREVRLRTRGRPRGCPAARSPAPIPQPERIAGILAEGDDDPPHVVGVDHLLDHRVAVERRGDPGLPVRAQAAGSSAITTASGRPARSR